MVRDELRRIGDDAIPPIDYMGAGQFLSTCATRLQQLGSRLRMDYDAVFIDEWFSIDRVQRDEILEQFFDLCYAKPQFGIFVFFSGTN